MDSITSEFSNVKYQNQNTNKNNYSTIVKNKFNTIANSSIVIDKLLKEYSDYIDPAYKKWFAKRFQIIPFDRIHATASEARGKNVPPNYFCSVIGKLYEQYNA